METMMFVIKCLVVTVVTVVCLQIRVGNHTVEGHLMGWVHHSSISHHLQDVAEGAVKISKRGKTAVSDLMGSNQETEEPAPTEASNGGWFKIKRSAAYYRQKERERKLQDARHDALKDERANEDRRAPAADDENSDRE